MQFKRIRLSGFKSFVDPTELHIERGLTGVVGPNGCGKSNLLEAIRWVMGENRAKSLRGSGMDDVIFAGTSKRPARNLADVTLTLDNSNRTAPAELNDSDELEVSRRIERESGSAYRLNGKDVRAKDIQLLFADAATGAHSPALVSQGRIGTIINAKPIQRRQILEEAAGISGLHSRRKEAESRLRAAENNLLRLHDVMAQLENQLSSLKRQARQATRYRNISGDIRRAEAIQLYLRWRTADEAVMETEKLFNQSHSIVADLTKRVSELTREEAELAEKLPQLRQTEAEAAAALHRLQVARENIDAEEARLKNTQQELRDRLQQIQADKAREAENQGDANAAFKRLDEELQAIEADKDKSKEQEKAAGDRMQQAHKAANEAETRYDALSRDIAAIRAKRESLQNELDSITRRVERLSGEKQRIHSELHDLTENDPGVAALKQAEERMALAEEELEKTRQLVRDCEQKRLNANEVRDQAKATLSENQNVLSEINAEISGLDKLLSMGRKKATSAIVDDLTVQLGFEKALGAALGDDLEASTNSDNDEYWHSLPDYEDQTTLPEGIAPLSDYVKAPSTLKRRLDQIGVVESEDIGHQLMQDLKPGQRLVTKDGAFWRWDGFVRSAKAPTAAAIRLQQRNRLKELTNDQENAQKQIDKAEEAYQLAVTQFAAANEEEKQARSVRGTAEREIGSARSDYQKAEKDSQERSQRIAALKEADTRCQNDLEEAIQQQETLKEKVADHPEVGTQGEKLDAARQAMEAARATLAEKRADFDALIRMRGERDQRLQNIAKEREAWQSRLSRANSQLSLLDERYSETEKQLNGLKLDPEEMQNRRKALIEQVEKSQATRKLAADKLAAAEKLVSEKTAELRSVQSQMTDKREERVRFEGVMENHKSRKQELAILIGEKFECPPSHVLEKVEISDPDSLPDQESIDGKLERLKSERERLGAVNLRADTELEEVSGQLNHLIDEKTDLEEAIGRLRQGINGLNREGRERMLKAFEEVNEHFSDLFTRLFGGGQAHLELVESDDPLEAGLEIMASPPGKRLQNLGLLSGGEQALTALSLIFAVFMTNPAPICVLDEVDAPLDDANVERFCNLLDQMIDLTETRFLIVTHNAVTMSRMDRLFGVTMAERGVSQLVSVDLEAAENLQAAS